MASDAELIQRAAEGDDKAFEALVERHREMVYVVAYRMAGHKEIALDIAQEAWIKVFKSLKKFRGEAAFKTWLYKVTTNQAISHLRRLKRQGGKLPPADETLISLAERGGDSISPEDAPEGDVILREAVRKAIDRLPPRQRTVFILKFYRGLTHEEIASILGRTTGAVKANYFHALKKLSVYLRPYGAQAGVGHERR